MNDVTIYTDGACSGNPGPGGYGVILMSGKYKKEISGGEAETTNNRMELMAVIVGLKTLKRPCTVTLYSDSQYVVNMVKLGWMEKWKRNGWMRNKSDPAKNVDLLKELDEQLHIHQVEMIWVKGHADNPYNNRCDELAVSYYKALGNGK